MVKKSILIDSLRGPYFGIRTAKVDRSRTDFTDFFSWKDVQKEAFWREVETVSLYEQ